ncbi:hypothetical protein R84981_001991 [Carnimonas sp. R-84981]|uniref:winged helix-turn-helix transcriptional regulator n=1 Tax=Carnimonas bestiolae TaxID=3402172 RepID=UPI003EDBE134
MLTRTLRQLERDHLITRHDRAEVPPHVEYSLNALGEEFLMKLVPVWLWIFENAEAFRPPEPAHRGE